MDENTSKRRRIQRIAFEKTRGNFKRLEWFGAKHHSQSDEDGILSEIFKRVGTTNKTFIDFGAEIGTENNSRYLLENGWNGLWIEGNPQYISALQNNGDPFRKAGNLTIIESYVNPDNINKLITEGKIGGEIDLLSIDIDSIDWYVFDAINVVNPRVLVLEHNSSFGPHEKYVMPLDLDYRWDPHNSCGIPNGASISSFVDLASKKNYQLVGCGLFSPNGFYVRKDLLMSKDGHNLFPYEKTTSDLYNPSIYEEILNYPVNIDLYPNLLEKILMHLSKK